MVNRTESIQIYKRCVKSVQIGSFSGPYFPVFRLNMERQSICPYSVPIQENTDQKKLHIWTLFTQCKIVLNGKHNSNVANESTN